MSRFAIIGAGFFGMHIASRLQRRIKHASVDIFDMDSSPLNGAATHNQCRLHLGFHYPRSGYTIYQSVMGFDRYLADYGDCTEDVPNNTYAVHRRGLVNANQYLAIMDAFSLRYEVVTKIPPHFVDPASIDVVLRVTEKCIDPLKLRRRLMAELDAQLHLGVRVDRIDPFEGNLFAQGERLGSYDFIVNASYFDPNLGLPNELAYPLKHELTALVLGRTSLPRETAITVMDGPFVSVYPAYDGLHTLSSVVHTPFQTYADAAGLYLDYPHRNRLAAERDVGRSIVEHVRSFLDVEVAPKELWVSAKTKLATEKGDSRVTEVKRHGRLFSVLCGKLDAVFSTSDQIILEVA